MARIRGTVAWSRRLAFSVGPLTFSLLMAGLAGGQEAPRSEPMAAPGPARSGVVFQIRVNGPEAVQHLRAGLADILSARLARPGEWKSLSLAEMGLAWGPGLSPPDEKTDLPGLLARIAEKGASHALTGTLDHEGDRYDLEMHVWDARSRDLAFRESIDGGSLEELLGKIDGLSTAILDGLAKTPATGFEAAALPQGPPPAWEEVAAAPTPIPPPFPEKMDAAPPAPASPSPEPSPTPAPTRAPGSVWRSEALPFGAVDIAVGDVDGDGRAEIVLAEPDAVHVYVVRGGALARAGETRARLVESFHGIDLFDLDDDGAREIAVSSMLHSRFQSFILGRKEGEWTRLIEEIPYFLRVLPRPRDGHESLAGQSLGPTGRLYGAIYPLRVEGGELVEEPPLDFGTDHCLSALYWGDMDGDGRDETVDVDLAGRLVVHRDGKLLWRSEASYGGFDNYFVRRAMTPEAGEDEIRIHLYDRILATGKVNGFPAERLLLTENLSPYGQILRNVTLGKSNVLRSLAWNGTGLFGTEAPFEYSPEDHGSAVLANATIADYDSDGETELLVAAVTTSPIPFGGSETVVFAFERRK